MSGQNVQRTGLHAPWREYAKTEEIQRVDELNARIERKKLSLQEAVAERQDIMNRSIRRMRRANGKS